MAFSISSVLIGAALLLLQFVVAVPWLTLAFLNREDRLALARHPLARWVMIRVGIVLAISLLSPTGLVLLMQDRSALEVAGRVYGAILQVQLTIDAFIFGFAILLALWPKGGAVALAAFREGVRQWMFWLVVLLAWLAMSISIFVPYFTFGEDYLMVKQLGYDTIMLVAVVFGCLASSTSISEEIEGRTAVTLMSKPLSRRQFLLGKFAGILLAAVFMFGILGAYFEGVLLVKHWWDKLTPLTELTEQARAETTTSRIGVVPTPPWVNEALKHWALPGQASDFLRGVGQWTAHSLDTLPGLVLCFSQVMVLIGLAVALATRVPMVVNLATVLVVFVASNLTPVLLSQSERSRAMDPTSPVPRLVRFVAQVFDTLLPDLGSFRMDPALLSEAPPPTGLFTQYVASVTFYGLIYTVIVLLLGLILFEDRDLA